MYSIDLFNLVYNQITNNKKQVASVILLQLMQFSYSMQYLLSYILDSYDAELLNVSIRRIRLFSRILLNRKNRRKFNL